MIGDGAGPLGVFGDYVEVPYASGENSLIAFAATDIYVVSPCKNASIGVDNTMTLNEIMKLYEENGYPIKSFNLFGFRNEKDIKKDVINDQLGFFTEKELFICPGTTDPGVYWTTSAERNKKGTLHLLPGYHERIWTFGKHKGYEALVNDPKKCKPTKGWRDTDYDFTRGPKDIVVCDYFGLNFHRMHESLVAKLIGKYSSACQVVQKSKDFEYILQRAKDSGLKTFDYALFEV